jgi:hypothetical protein
MPPQRGQGQWALGHREPLNQNERVKRDDDGLNARQRIIDRYRYAGFDSIDPADLRSRFRWLGLYTRERQASRAPAVLGRRLEDATHAPRTMAGRWSSEQLTTSRHRIEFGQTSPMSPTGERPAALDPHRRTSGDQRRLKAVVGLRACGDTQVIRRRPAWPRTRCWTRRRRCGRCATAASRPRVLNLPTSQSSIPAAAPHQPRDRDVSFVGVVGPAYAGFDPAGGGLTPTRSSASGWARSSGRPGRQCRPGSPQSS